MRHYLITGGAGFIGSDIAHELVRHGEKVKVVDNFSTGNMDNVSDILGEIELIEADVRDLESMRRAVEGVDFVLHQAALISVVRSVNEPIIANEVNVTGTLNMLVAARDAGVKRFIYAASASAYGDTFVLPLKEDMATCPPLSPYAAGKLIGEHYCRIFYHLYGLETVCLRYFNVFGPRQDPLSEYSAVIPRFITAMLKNEPIIIYGDGEQTRDFVYVQNVVNANFLACKDETSAGATGEVINIASGYEISLNQLILAIEKCLGIKSRRVYTRPRIGGVRHSRADITKARELLGYEPVINFNDGLSKTIEWFSTQLSERIKNS